MQDRWFECCTVTRVQKGQRDSAREGEMLASMNNGELMVKERANGGKSIGEPLKME